MEFPVIKKETILLDPRRNWEPRAVPSEIRADPLTGRTARICHFMKLAWPKPDFDHLIAGTETNCPFCPDKVLRVTPQFPPELFPEGRLVDGDLVLFPNLAPYDSLSAVASLGHQHFRPMTDFRPERIKSALDLTMTFFRRLQAAGHPESRYHIVNWNYMPPAGSSLIHPHLQVFCTSTAPNLPREELAAGRIYAETHGRNYWEDLVRAEEASGERFLTRLGRSVWLAAYAPLGVAGDVLAVVPGATSTLDLTDADLNDLARGLTRAMAGYDRMGIYSFNMSYQPGAAGDDHATFHLLFSPRAFFNQALGTTDVGALRQMHNESICMAYPEEIAQALRPDFQMDQP